jgi:pSer/pThr/pTyr-binding forkhead associated (FHA) protein
MPVRLRYLAHDLEVPLGQFLIGRTTDCQLSLDDPLVSRRHAVLMVQLDGVFIEDLRSRNGVLVNGLKIEGRRRVNDGDVIRIGTQDLFLSGVGDVPSSPSSSARNPLTITMQDVRVPDIGPPSEEGDMTGMLPIPSGAALPDKRVDALSLIGALADKALALGRVDEAERILQRTLHELLSKSGKGQPLAPELAEKAAFYAARLAAGTGKGAWVNYVFELYGNLRALMPGRLVDELYAVMRKVKSIDRVMLRAYLTCLREIAHGFGPAERFVQQRIEGFERWAP